MNATPILRWPFPAYQDRAWNGTWEDMMSAIDSDLYSAIEDGSCIVYGGGTISLNPATHEVSWDDNLDIYAVLSQGRIRVAPSTLSGVTDGMFIVAPVARPINTITSGSLSVVASMQGISDMTFIAQRRGSELFMTDRYYSIIVGT